MKTVLLARHAKSSWGDLTLADFDRPLNERGKADAPKMAKRLLSKEIRIDSFISSPAKRAKKTAKVFAKEYGVDKSAIILVPALYEPSVSAFSEAIANAPEASTSIALFSHNPGITEYVNTLTATRVDNMPTCSVFAVKANVEKWADFHSAEKEFYFFEFPKSADSD